MNVFRRLPLSRLLLLCGLAVAIGVSATALASALGGGAKPPAKPLAQAVHDALTAPPVQGLSAQVTLTDHLVEGANLASESQGGEIASNPLLTGASGRLWVAADGRLRLELQAEKGDTQVIYDGHTVTAYDAATNKLYRYTPPAGQRPDTTPHHGEAPSLAKIEEAIDHIRAHAGLSGATPDNVAGQPAYTVRLSPSEGGSLIGGAELSFDAANGTPLRAAIYSSTSSSPVIELAATEVSYGPVDGSVFSFTPPSNAQVQELKPTEQRSHSGGAPHDANAPKLTTHGHGITAIDVLEAKVKPGSKTSGPEGLPKVSINGISASELRTALGTVLTFERAGVRYVVAGALDPAAIEALARGL